MIELSSAINIISNINIYLSIQFRCINCKFNNKIILSKSGAKCDRVARYENDNYKTYCNMYKHI